MTSKEPAEEQRAGLNVQNPNFALFMLTLAYSMAYVDRQLLNLLVDPIKRSILISDTQFSLLQGSAFVVAYLAAAPFFGRAVDVGNRRNILVFGVTAWSFFTFISGFCGTYEELFLARMGVGITEACILPVAWSMLGDLFDRKSTPRALSVFALAPQLGGGFALIAGGLIFGYASALAAGKGALSDFEGWQLAFMITGIPGLLFALWLALGLREPTRRTSASEGGLVAETPLSIKETWAHLWLERSYFGRLLLANGMLATVQLAIPMWVPAFLIRAHDLTTTEAGLRLGILSAVIAPIATLSGPIGAAFLARRGYVDNTLRAVMLCAIPMTACAIALPIMPNANSALAVAGLAIFVTGFPAGLLAAGTQMSTPTRMRGVMGSLYTFAAQSIGYMIGPTVIALFTDRLFGDPKMVGWSLQIVMVAASALLFGLIASVMRSFRERISAAG